jgi:hypothetical protein
VVYIIIVVVVVVAATRIIVTVESLVVHSECDLGALFFNFIKLNVSDFFFFGNSFFCLI